MTDLNKLWDEAQITKPVCVDYVELGPDDNRRLYAFLVEGDPEDNVIICVDEEPTGTEVPSPRLELIAAAVNAVPELLALREEVGRFKRALQAIAKEQSATTATEAADRMQFIARAALNQEGGQ